MNVIPVHSFAAGHWIAPDANARLIANAYTGEALATAGNDALDVQGMLDYARTTGGVALRALSFHDRARMLKAIATYLNAHKQTLYDLSFNTGATQADNVIDIDGGIGTVFVFASKGRRELPDAQVYLDGDVEQLSRNGSFLGQHICTPLQGVAIHINAYNFPVWGMLEKLAPAILAGVPAIVKPATVSSYVTEACVRLIQESGVLPAGALQLIAGGCGDLLEHLDSQDVVAFTGSAETALKLRSIPGLLKDSVRFSAEQDSLNASILGSDVTPDMPEFKLFIDEVQRELTTKAGQKCTAIRRILVPAYQTDAVIAALKDCLAGIETGDPRLANTQMGSLISNDQKQDVLDKTGLMAAETERVFGDPDNFTVNGIEPGSGAFLPPLLFYCADPDKAQRVHDTEAFGPVATVLPYRDTDHAVELANRGKGSLVASVITHDGDIARQITLGSAAWHGRLYFNNRDSMKESTGHGAPLPHMVHGGPGRAGGGEELGGIRSVMHYMQRTAIQGSPDILSAVGKQWVPGSKEITESAHPFTRTFRELTQGETLYTPARVVSSEDIDHFAEFTGDTFYAHTDDAAAAANPFFPGRVAHGYLLLSFAAGLFVEPNVGPVLANTGLDKLRFMKPVVPGDSIKVRLTVKNKTRRNDEYGEVRWHVTLRNQEDEDVAEYELLTMNSY